MLAVTSRRVQDNTAPEVNERIRAKTERSITYHAMAGQEAINARLHDLDREWDIERFFETTGSIVGLLGVVLGLTSNRKWFLLPGLVSAFMLQHALQGWCPTLGPIRRLGFRTVEEIAQERYALKALRGDFKDVPIAVGAEGESIARQVLDATRR